MRRRRVELSADPAFLHAVLTRRNSHANEIANHTLERVRHVMDMSYQP